MPLLAAVLAIDNFVVAPAEPAQFEKIVALVNEAYQPNHPLVTEEQDTPLTVSQIKSIYFHPNSKLFVLIDKTKKAIAGVLVVDYSPRMVHQATLGLFAIEKDYRGKDLGQLLFQHAEHFVKRLGKTEMALSVERQNTQLVAYYEKLGYKKSDGQNHVDLKKSLN